MHLAADLYSEAHRLFTKDWELSKVDCGFLNQEHAGVSALIRTPALDKLVPFADYSRDENISLQARRVVAEAFTECRDWIKAKKEWSEVIQKSLKEKITKTLTYVQYNPAETVYLQPDVSDNYLTNHTANVFYLALALGDRLREYVREERQSSSSAKIANPKSLGPLALGAFFHDAGLIPHEKLIQSVKKLSPTQVSKIQSHPETGCDNLTDILPPVARQTMISHHENFNGSGYPGGLAGRQINVYSRILRVADAYCAATSRRVYRKAKSPAETLHEMVRGRFQAFYDPQVLKEIEHVIQPFPIGCRLKMSSGELAVVVGHQPGLPFHPRVVIAFNSNGKPASKFSFENPFTLDCRGDLTIVSCGKDDLSALFQERPSKTSTASKKQYSEALDLVYP